MEEHHLDGFWDLFICERHKREKLCTQTSLGPHISFSKGYRLFELPPVSPLHPLFLSPAYPVGNRAVVHRNRYRSSVAFGASQSILAITPLFCCLVKKLIQTHACVKRCSGDVCPLVTHRVHVQKTTKCKARKPCLNTR